MEAEAGWYPPSCGELSDQDLNVPCNLTPTYRLHPAPLMATPASCHSLNDVRLLEFVKFVKFACHFLISVMETL